MQSITDTSTEITDSVDRETAKQTFSKMDMLAVENPPSKTEAPIEHAGYILRLQETHEVLVDQCELCGQKNAIVASLMSVNDRWFHDAHLCEVCAPNLTRIDPSGTPFDDLQADYETTVGDPLDHLSDDMRTKIQERFNWPESESS
jgi:hypothetical protein